MNIINELKNNANQDYRKFNLKICQTKYEMLGVKVPILRKMAKDLLKKYSYQEIFNNLNDNVYECLLLKGIIIGSINISLNERLKLIDNYLVQIDCWALCDIFVSNLKFVKKYPKEMFNYVNNLLNHQEEYYLRFVIVILLTYYLNDTYYQDVLNILLSIKSNYFYVKMALAWAYSISLIKYFDETISFLSNNKNNIDKWTYNKALQKGRESFKLSKEQKEILKNLKIT